MTTYTKKGLTLLLVLCATAPLGAQKAAPIYSAEVESIIHPASAEFMIEVMNRADGAKAGLVVFTLRTPGGLVDSTREIITRMLAAKTPVAIFVGPSGSRAAGSSTLPGA